MLEYRLAATTCTPTSGMSAKPSHWLDLYLQRVYPLVPFIPQNVRGGFTATGAVLNPTGALSTSPATSFEARALAHRTEIIEPASTPATWR